MKIMWIWSMKWVFKKGVLGYNESIIHLIRRITTTRAENNHLKHILGSYFLNFFKYFVNSSNITFFYVYLYNYDMKYHCKSPFHMSSSNFLIKSISKSNESLNKSSEETYGFAKKEIIKQNGLLVTNCAFVFQKSFN